MEWSIENKQSCARCSNAVSGACVVPFCHYRTIVQWMHQGSLSGAGMKMCNFT